MSAIRNLYELRIIHPPYGIDWHWIYCTVDLLLVDRYLKGLAVRNSFCWNTSIASHFIHKIAEIRILVSWDLRTTAVDFYSRVYQAIV